MRSTRMGTSIYVAVSGEAFDFDEHRNKPRKLDSQNGIVSLSSVNFPHNY